MPRQCTDTMHRITTLFLSRIVRIILKICFRYLCFIDNNGKPFEEKTFQKSQKTIENVVRISENRMANRTYSS